VKKSVWSTSSEWAAYTSIFKDEPCFTHFVPH